jgi:hypothetical protein
MTKEEFIQIAKQSSDRADMLERMGYEFSKENVQKYIRFPRIAYGISRQEMFDYFVQPTISKELYLTHVSSSVSEEDLLCKLGYPNSLQNRVKHIVDVGLKYGVPKMDRVHLYTKNLSVGSPS